MGFEFGEGFGGGGFAFFANFDAEAQLEQVKAVFNRGSRGVFEGGGDHFACGIGLASIESDLRQWQRETPFLGEGIKQGRGGRGDLTRAQKTFVDDAGEKG